MTLMLEASSVDTKSWFWYSEIKFKRHLKLLSNAYIQFFAILKQLLTKWGNCPAHLNYLFFQKIESFFPYGYLRAKHVKLQVVL